MKRTILYLAAAAALCAAALTSCVQDNIYGSPTIGNVGNTVAYTGSDDVTVTAAVSSLAGIKAVTLYWSAGGDFTAVSMKQEEDVWTGTIPAQPVGTEVTWYIEALSNTGESVASKTFSYVVGDAPVDYTGLILNELNGHDKFIELYNSSANDIPVNGLIILKDEEEVWTGPEMTVKAGEFLLLYSEDVVVAGEAQEGYPEELVFGSGLSAKKAVRVRLATAEGETLDDFNCSKHPGTEVPGSYGRNSDGEWYIQETATPGEANVDGEESVESWLE